MLKISILLKYQCLIFSKMSTVYKCRGCNMTTLSPLGSTKSDSKNMKYNLLSGPPVDKKCEHCGFTHLVSS